MMWLHGSFSMLMGADVQKTCVPSASATKRPRLSDVEGSRTLLAFKKRVLMALSHETIATDVPAAFPSKRCQVCGCLSPKALRLLSALLLSIVSAKLQHVYPPPPQLMAILLLLIPGSTTEMRLFCRTRRSKSSHSAARSPAHASSMCRARLASAGRMLLARLCAGERELRL